MNSSIIIDDIRRRSIRLQRDQFLDRIRQEEDFYEQPLPKRIIIEAEERAKDRISSSGWKKMMFVIFLFIAIGYIIFKSMLNNSTPEVRIPTRAPRMVTTEIQTDSPLEKKAVRFEIDNHLEKLKDEFPTEWRSFETNFRREWLRSPISGLLTIHYYNSEMNLVVDVFHNDMLVYPNQYHETVEQFENFIFEKNLKMRLCEENGIQYQEIFIDT